MKVQTTKHISNTADSGKKKSTDLYEKQLAYLYLFRQWVWTLGLD